MMTKTIFGNARRRPRSRPLRGLLSGVAAGAGLMYLLDPRRGSARRARLRQRAERVIHEAQVFVESGARDLEHRASGLAHEASARLQHRHVPEEVLAERVRSALGHLSSHPRAIEVEVRGAEVELRGPVLMEEHGRILRGVRLVRGVHLVVDRLAQHAEVTGISSLQGGARPAPPVRRESWSPGARLLAGAGGGFLFLRAVLGRGLLRLIYGLAGGALLARAAGSEALGSLSERLAARARALGREGAEPVQEAAGRAGEAVERARAAAERAAKKVEAAGATETSASATAGGAAERVREGPDAAAVRPQRTVEEVKSPAEHEERPASRAPRHAPPPEETMPEQVRAEPPSGERAAPRSEPEAAAGPAAGDPAFTAAPKRKEERGEVRREEPGEGE